MPRLLRLEGMIALKSYSHIGVNVVQVGSQVGLGRIDM